MLAEEAACTGRRVLVVEDDALVQLMLERLVRQLGHEVERAGSPAQALVRLAARPFDLLITDYELPGMTGLQLARRAKADRPALRVIIASGWTVEPSPGEVDAMIDKPYSAQELADAVHMVLSDP